jgi:hypothetical protein
MDKESPEKKNSHLGSFTSNDNLDEELMFLMLCSNFGYSCDRLQCAGLVGMLNQPPVFS